MLLDKSSIYPQYRIDPDSLGWDFYPAKSNPWKTLKQHSMETSAVMTALTENFPQLKALLPEHFEFFALAHDCGKISSSFLSEDGFRDWFQSKFGPVAMVTTKARHEVISESALQVFLNNRIDHTECIVGWHHGRRNADVAKSYGSLCWDEARNKMLNEVAQLISPPMQILPAWQQILCAGLLCIADWIASGEDNFIGDCTGTSLHSLMPEARAVLQRIGFTPPEVRPHMSFENIFGFTPNAMQRTFSENISGPGVYILETVMGAGKTEAALYATYQLLERKVNHGFYFALPTRLTSNRIQLRVNDFLQKICLDHRGSRLMHGAAFLEPAGGEFAVNGGWFAPSKRALLYPFGVGTVDQALLGVLNLKHFFVRLAGLAGKVVIIDEAHSYDFFTGFLLDKLCRILTKLGCTVIILSATLGKERRSELLGAPVTLDHYPLLSSNNGIVRELPLERPTTVCYQLDRIPPIKAPERAVELARNGCNVLLMANTVAETQQYFQLVKSLRHEGEFPVGLLHSNFPQFRREELELQWVECLGKPRVNSPRRPQGSVLVCSQIVEQSVDIDADVLISELAPSDLLFQRFGRVWRHRRDNRPLPGPLCILIDRNLSDSLDKTQFMVAAGPAARVYHPYVLYRTHLLWRNLEKIAIPDDLRRLIASTYVDPQTNDPAFVQDFYRDLCDKRKSRQQRAEVFSRDNLYFASLPQELDDESATTRYQEQPRQGVVLLKKFVDNGSRLMIQLLNGESFELGNHDRFRLDICRALHRNMLSLARYRLPKSWLASLGPAAWQVYSSGGELLPVMVGFDGALTSPLQQHDQTGLFYTAEFGVAKDITPQLHGGNEIELDW